MKAIAKLLNPFQETKIGGTTFHHNNLAGLRLFAVTQDIKVGDETIYSDMQNVRVKINNQEQLDNFRKGELIKILGELSPQATFVKDGDEIEVQEFHKEVSKEESEFEREGYYFITHLKVECPTCNTHH